MNERTLFMAALEIDPAKRCAYLDDSCRGNPELRKRVEALIHSHEQAASFLNSPPPGIETADFCDAHFVTEVPGDTIGPYTLVEQIGQGGFGIVFLAEQVRPVRRRVALKVIKPGMDTREVVARFDVERQAVAMMDHPSIAKVLDAGATASGRPYFVMELVQGVPITEYCDQCNLTSRERLNLYVAVCQAVQHAHQKGVIHRDIKPTNVLVSLQDGRPAPKIIDFGVAKALNRQLTEHTLATGFTQMLGTPLYMSPEQAELSPLGADTRSDIYSLGVLLYELLTGTTPFDSDRFQEASYDELRRIIREEDPPRPSTRLSTLAAADAATIAEHRHTDARRLQQQVRGELEWIVMKCLEKDRNRRYDTASALAADVLHHLADESVNAGPPSRVYRASKFIRRNRGPVVAALLLIAAILGGVGASAWQAIRATRAERTAWAERDARERALRQAVASADAERAAKEREAAQRKKAEDISNFLISAFNVQYPEHDIQAVAEVLKNSAQEIQDVYSDNSAANEALLATIGRAHAGLRRFEDAERMYRKCLDVATDPGLIDRVRRELATCLLRQGKSGEALPILQEFYLEKLHQAESSYANELLAVWPGLPEVEANTDGAPGMDGLEMDGDGDYVILPRVFFDGCPPWTLEVIVWPLEIDQSNPATGSPDGWTSLISAADAGSIGLDSIRRRWTIELYTAGIPGEEWTDNYASASARVEVPLRQWQHVAGVWDGQELRIYLDGRRQPTRSGVDYCSQLAFSPLFLGADPSNLAYGRDVAEGFLHGRLRAARISRGIEYTESFKPPQQLEKTPDTIGLYDFTIDYGQYAIDSSGHGNHGIIMGAKYAKDELGDK